MNKIIGELGSVKMVSQQFKEKQSSKFKFRLKIDHVSHSVQTEVLVNKYKHTQGIKMWF